MKKTVVYVHGMGGSADESRHYESLFPQCAVTGLEYNSFTPWEAGEEIAREFAKAASGSESVTLIANSVGAFFSAYSGVDRFVRRAYFISPVVDMERMITDMMRDSGVTEETLRACGTVLTRRGELSWEYLRFVREHPIVWRAPTEILFGSNDDIVPFETVKAFAAAHGAGLTVMEGGEHWFHTAEQMRFLDEWMIRNES